jgi:hypothetical protein
MDNAIPAALGHHVHSSLQSEEMLDVKPMENENFMSAKPVV